MCEEGRDSADSVDVDSDLEVETVSAHDTAVISRMRIKIALIKMRCVASSPFFCMGFSDGEFLLSSVIAQSGPAKEAIIRIAGPYSVLFNVCAVPRSWNGYF